MHLYNRQLCACCRLMFEGHWAPISPVPLSEEQLYRPDASDEFSDTESGISEPAVWEHAVNEVCHVSGHRPYLHHRLPELQISAAEGCKLCTMIFDQVQDAAKALDPVQLINLQQAVNSITISPREHSWEQHSSLLLEVFHNPEEPDKVKNTEPLETVEINLEILPAEAASYDSGRQPGTEAEYIPDYSPLASVSEPSKTVLEHIGSWANDCNNDHKICKAITGTVHQKELDPFLPTRLLDVSLAKTQQTINLRLSADLDQCSAYITLSHCWGGIVPIRLLQASFSTFRSGLPLRDLPQTFQDAVRFTAALNVRYLWIDALCIIQDSEEDWVRESLQMANVYSNSLLTIAATAAQDSHGGLFRQTNPVLKMPCLVDASWTGLPAGQYICLDQSAWDRRVVEAPLNTRAWVFQERMLATRTVHFARDQIWWECHCCKANETFPTGVPNLSGDILDMISPMTRLLYKFDHDNWREMISYYTKTSITKDSDRHLALAGLATRFAQATKTPEDDYIAGVWKAELLLGLLWRTSCLAPRRLDSHTTPSWSWSSVKGSVVFSGKEDSDSVLRNSLATVLDVDLNTKGGPFGLFISGTLTLRAPLYTIRIGMQRSRLGCCPGTYTLVIGLATLLLNVEDIIMDLDDVEKPYKEGELEAYFCRISTYEKEPYSPYPRPKFVTEGLILQHAEGREAHVYQRLGWMSLMHHEAELFFKRSPHDPPIGCLRVSEDGLHTFMLI